MRAKSGPVSGSSTRRVVYFLGAGFSAPFGLPVMSTFLEKSKDLYFENPSRYGHFQEVFEEIGRMSIVKNCYKTDLFNIEEILSILTMQKSLRGRKLNDVFVRYIRDVIDYYTPRPQRLAQKTPVPKWKEQLFSSIGEVQQSLAFFVASLAPSRILRASPGAGTVHAETLASPPKVKYDVISLNYDKVLENFARYIQATVARAPISFQVHGGPETAEEVASRPTVKVTLAKLHGSVDSPALVAPTWNKDVKKPLRDAWKSALELLENANHIRIIGYSLPTSDAYIKYLLRAAAIASPNKNLKKIDVLCLDDRRESLRQRYQEFVDFPTFRFANQSVEQYLRAVREATIKPSDAEEIELKHLEEVHELFFKEYGG